MGGGRTAKVARRAHTCQGQGSNAPSPLPGRWAPRARACTRCAGGPPPSRMALARHSRLARCPPRPQRACPPSQPLLPAGVGGRPVLVAAYLPRAHACVRARALLHCPTIARCLCACLRAQQRACMLERVRTSACQLCRWVRKTKHECDDQCCMHQQPRMRR